MIHKEVGSFLRFTEQLQNTEISTQTNIITPSAPAVEGVCL